MSLLLLLGSGGTGGPPAPTISVSAIASGELVPGPLLAPTLTLATGAIATGETVNAPNVFAPLSIFVPVIPSGTGSVVGPTFVVDGVSTGGPSSPEYLPRITAANYSRAGGFVVDLDESYARRWTPDLNDTGAAELTVQNDLGGLSAVNYGSVVRFSLDGQARFAMLVERKLRKSIEQGEERGQTTSLSGRGTLAAWEEAVVYPELGAGRQGPDVRSFNFASTSYDDSSWGYAVQSEQGVGDVGGSREGAPQGWPDPEAWWIWSEYSSTLASVPAGDAYFRKSFTVASGTLVAIFCTGDNEFDLWLDGESIMKDTLSGGVGWGGTKRTDVYLDAGEHLIAIRGSNAPGTNPNPAGVLVSVFSLGAQGTALGTRILKSDNTWRALGYPSSPPGFSPGQVVRILRDEFSNRGGDGVALAFDDYTDSAGVAWPVTPEISVRVGLDYLNVLRQLAETYFDMRMAIGTMTLYAYSTMGTTRPVTLAAGANLRRLTHDGRA